MSSLSDLPWCCIGDFNDILDHSKKQGPKKQPEWLIQGFRSTIGDTELVDLGLIGDLFTWERGCGIENWV